MWKWRKMSLPSSSQQHVSNGGESIRSVTKSERIVYSVNVTAIVIAGLFGIFLSYIISLYIATLPNNNSGGTTTTTSGDHKHHGQHAHPQSRSDLRGRKGNHLGVLPSDVSWFSSGPDLEKCTEYEGGNPVKTHSALDAHTLQVARKKLATKASSQAEAKASYKAALEMMLQGKGGKAKKLLQHALLLDPLDSDILNTYGEFVEPHDIVLADHMFNQAIVVNPSHSRALINRQRTAPLVQEIDSVLYQRIDNKLDLLMHIPESHPGLRRLKKELYYKHIYHTIAIEGNTLNLHQTRAIIETRVAVGGKSLLEQNEVLGMDAALSYINSTLLSRIGKIALDDILEIHRRVLGFNDPVEAGQLRNTQVFVGDFIPPRPGEVQALMDEFIDWLNSEDTLRLHPIRLSAIAHYRLVTIHPFYDGNGRTSRLLMNLILMNAGYPPVMIKVEDKHEYYKHLETSNRGDIRPFIRFIATCTEATVDEYIRAVSEDSRNIQGDVTPKNQDFDDDGRTIIIDADEHITDEP